MVGGLPDVITCAEFQVEIFSDHDFTGVGFPVFLLIFAWALQQCNATALPVIRVTFMQPAHSLVFVVDLSGELTKLQWYKYLLGKLPEVNYCTLKRIITHLAR